MLRIKEDRMNELEKFGFAVDQYYIYPKYYIRRHGETSLRIVLEDNGIDTLGEIWGWKGCFGCAENEAVEPYIKDLIKADMVEEVE